MGLSAMGHFRRKAHYFNHQMPHRTLEHLTHLIECRNIISAVWENVKEMRSAAYCGEFISLLVLDRTRRGVAKLVRIECSRIEQLALAFEACVFRILSSDPAVVLFNTISTIANDVSAACRQLLTDFDIRIPSTADLKDHWRCAVHVLDVAALSYCGAHTLFLGNDKVTSISLPGLSCKLNTSDSAEDHSRVLDSFWAGRRLGYLKCFFQIYVRLIQPTCLY